MRRAGAAAPGSVPALLGKDDATGALAMEWLPPADHAPWKDRLRDGHADAAFAAEVARRLARIHAAAAADPAVAEEFKTDAIFHDIRLEPYLLATARAHPDLAAPLERLAEVTAATKPRWFTATSARKTSWSDRTGRCSWTRSARGGATPLSTSPSASTTCC